MNLEEFKTRAKKKKETIQKNYTFDRTEFGKILIITSITLAIFSLHGIYTLQGTMQQLDQTSQEINAVYTALNTEEFNRTIEVVADLQTSQFGEEFAYAVSTLQQSQETIQNVQEAQEQIETLNEHYQWLLLISILSAVAGITIILI